MTGLRRALSLTLAILSVPVAVAAPKPDARRLERSYWLHASLADDTRRGYWGPAYPAPPAPTEGEVRAAARLLCGPMGANRLYLIYHGEITASDATRVFGWWRRACPRGVEIVPTLVLRMYDREMTPTFTTEQTGALCGALRRVARARRIAIYDVYPNRDQGPALAVLRARFPGAIVRVGLQPGEAPLAAVGAVEDTWSALCHGKTGADWLSPGFGAETLRRWVAERRSDGPPVAWDLVTVAWDYLPTPRGEYPGYDDAARNMALPPGRNQAAAAAIVANASSGAFAGFSSDLFILHVNSRDPARDGNAGSLYACLRRGQRYRGYFAAPMEEIMAIYGDLARGRLPGLAAASPAGRRPTARQ